MFALVTAQLAAFGHLVGGGMFPDLSALLTAGVVSGLGIHALTRRRRGFPIVLGVLAASQVLFHVLFSLSNHGGHLDAGRMAAFHLVAALLTAVALTRGDAALFRLAALWRRIAPAPVTPHVPPGRPLAVLPHRPVLVHGLLAERVARHPRRGPPALPAC